MLRDRKFEIVIDYLLGRRSAGQIINLCKYIFGKPKSIVNWNPVYLSVCCTYRCNLHCDMCLTHSRAHDNLYGQKPCPDMDFKTFKRILDQYRDALVLNLIGSGEPLLNADFFKMAEYASKERKMYVVSSTNGTMVGRYKEQLASSCLDYMNVSINGFDPADYVRLTGMAGEYFDQITKDAADLVNLRNSLHNKKFRIWGSFIVDRKNYIKMPEMFNLSRQIGLDGILLFPFIPSPKDGFRPQDRGLFGDEAEVLNKFKEIKKLAGARVKIMVHLLDRGILEKGYKPKYCRVPFYNLIVDGNGDIGGCGCQLLNNSGNGKFYDEDAWNNTYFQNLRNSFLDPGLPILEPCTWCYYNSPFKV